METTGKEMQRRQKILIWAQPNKFVSKVFYMSFAQQF